MQKTGFGSLGENLAADASSTAAVLLSLGMFRTAKRSDQSDDGGDDASNEHPDGFVSRRSSKEPGHIGAKGVRGVEPIDHEHNSTNEQNNREDSIHNDLSISLCV